MSKFARIAVAVLLVSVACPAQKIGEVPKVKPSKKSPRGETLEWTSTAERPYWYRLPKKIDAKKPPNLIVMLHGTGMNHGWAFWNYGVGGGTFRPDDIVISPDGCTPGGRTFNFDQRNKKDIDQIADLIKLFKKVYPVNNVYLYGHSQGAFFCYTFAGEHPELVDAFIAHAGNVLSAKHPKVAKENVGVAILHGKVDQVVSVAAAHRTYKIYKDLGYKKLKLEIVEGLRKEAGHWPLPTHVKKLLEWCDRVSTKTARGAIDIAKAAVEKDPVDLVTVAESLASAKKLIKKHKGKDKAELARSIAIFDDLVSKAGAAHGAAFQPMKSADYKKYGPWAAHFRAVHPALARDGTFKKQARAALAKAKSDTKAVNKALDKIQKAGAKAFSSAFKTWQKAILAEGYAELDAALALLKESKVNEKAKAAFEKQRAERKAVDEEGLKAAASTTKGALEQWRGEQGR